MPEDGGRGPGQRGVDRVPNDADNRPTANAANRVPNDADNRPTADAVAGGDVNDDGAADVITGAGPRATVHPLDPALHGPGYIRDAGGAPAAGLTGANTYQGAAA